MRSIWISAGVLTASALWAAPARAQEDGLEARLARVEQQLAQPSAREVQSSVDAYLLTAEADASLVGGCGSAGYDGGFWIRGGSFRMKINLTIQTRYEAFRWDDESREPSPGGDLSGFSLPRMTLKFSGDATCDVHYYAELEFGHQGNAFGVGQNSNSLYGSILSIHEDGAFSGQLFKDPKSLGIAREAWIEYEAAPALAFRMGLVKTAATRQLMTPPEMQQFVDVALASSFIGQLMPGWTDRNRDYGVMLHGVLGCDGEWSYLVTVTNGDGPVRRNVLDQLSNDNLAYSGRINWDLKGHMGYEEGALRQHDCEWTASVGAWAYAYTDVLRDKPHTNFADRLDWGFDAAAGYGSWSLTAAYNHTEWANDVGFSDIDGWSYLVQVGFLFPDTAWEIAARYDVYSYDQGSSTLGATEIGGAINYYIDGHGDKVTLDAALIQPDDLGNYVSDTYSGYSTTQDSDAWLVRLQWQLAL